MAEIRYLISDAAKKVDVESHVLRYWEDELEMQIPRNEMGHRYYTDYQIRLFRQIKELKEKGYQLKAIKNALNKMSGGAEEITIAEEHMEEDMKAAWKESQVRERHMGEKPTKEKAGEEEKAGKAGAETESEETGLEAAVPVQSVQATDITSEKMVQLQGIMNHIIGQAMEANIERISREITKEVSENVTETISENVSENVTDRVMKEVEYLLRVNDEKEEERFKQLDETIRAYQKNGRGRSEAAATKMPFFKKRKFGKSGKKLF